MYLNYCFDDIKNTIILILYTFHCLFHFYFATFTSIGVQQLLRHFPCCRCLKCHNNFNFHGNY